MKCYVVWESTYKAEAIFSALNGITLNYPEKFKLDSTLMVYVSGPLGGSTNL